MPITFGGLSSGLDTNGIIDSLVKIERIPIDQIHAQQTNVNRAKESLSALLGKLSALSSAAATLADPGKVSSLSTSVSSPGVVASTSAGALPGSYSVQVMSLAHEQRTHSDAHASSTAALGKHGTMSIQLGGGAVGYVDVTDDDSLTSIASKIQTSGARVSAAVIFDGSQYRLVVRGRDSGANNSIVFSEAGFSLGFDDPANTVQAATDAVVKIDGITVTRPQNLVTGAIPGVSLALTKTMDEEATLTLLADPAALGKQVGALVTAYNDVVSSAHQLTGYGMSKPSNPLLAADSAIRSTLDRLSRLLTEAVPGTSGKYGTLGSVGLSLTRDGSLGLDATKLGTAMGEDPLAVERIFVTNPDIGATGAMGTLKALIDSLTVGPSSRLASRVSALGAQATRLGDDADRLEIRSSAYMDGLRKQFTQLELAMSDIKSQGNAISSIFTSSKEDQ